VYQTLRSGTHSFSAVAAYYRPDAILVDADGASQEAFAYIVSEGFFDALGVSLALGRGFLSENEETSNRPAYEAILSPGFAKRTFGDSRSSLGRAIRIGARWYTVVGVVPDGFTGPDLLKTDVWLPMGAAAEQVFGHQWKASSGSYWLRILVRLGPGVSRLLAQRDVQVALSRVEAQQRSVAFASLRLGLSDERSESVKVSTWLLVVALLVFATACANVSSMLLARTTNRRRELAVCLAIGAPRSVLVTYVLAETLTLTWLGGVAALWLGGVGGKAFRTLLLPDLETPGSVLDWRVAGAALVATFVAAALTGTVAARDAVRTDVIGAMRDQPELRRFARLGARGLFVAVQIGLVFALMVGAGLFTTSLARAKSIELGLDAANVLVVTADRTRAQSSTVRPALLFHELLRRAASLPGVERVALGTAVPFKKGMGYAVWVPHFPRPPALPTGVPYYNAVTPDFFSVTGTRIVRGRAFTTADQRGTARVAVVNRTMAHFVWGSEDILGQCMHLGESTEPCTSVVGVAEDAKQMSITEDPRMEFYVPMDQADESPDGYALFVRVGQAASAVRLALQRDLVTSESSLGSLKVQALQSLVDPQLRSWVIGSRVFGGFGIVALAVACFGVYGLLSYEVGKRTHEVRVRMALGARPGQIIIMMVRRSLALYLLGMAFGVPLAVALARAVAALLFGVSPLDAKVLGAAAVAIFAAVLMGSLLPAIRASKVEPVTGLSTG